MIGTLILQAISRPPSAEDYNKAAASTEIDDALEKLFSAFPDLKSLVKGRRVLDFGCGVGQQSVALAKELGAIVTGLDTNQGVLVEAKHLAFHHKIANDHCTFVDEIGDEKYDIIISQDAMEHFPDPAAILKVMKDHLAPGGKALITFSPPWFAPYGHHMHFFCKLPWLNLMFSEKTVMKVRAKYRNDGATKYTEVESGLNKMTLAKFERLVSDSGLTVSRQNYRGVKDLNFLTRIPVIRELMTNRVTCVLSHPD